MSRGRGFPAARVGAVGLLLIAGVLPSIAGTAAGGETLSDLRARMAAIQARLDAATRRIEALRTQQDSVAHRIEEIAGRMDVLHERDRRLERVAVKRANLLYRSGGTQLVSLLLEARDLAEFTDRAEMLSRASVSDTQVFVRLARSRAELTSLSEELTVRRTELARTRSALDDESRSLQATFDDVAADYRRLQERLAEAPAPAPAPDPGPAARVRTSGAMACPVAGPVSFTDTWGAPRSGHTHQGVDMMAAAGTPLVAIVSGSITYAGYGSSAGNWLILSGDDGNGYWYMHNERNLVSGGRVAVGQRIATVGDTGNAAGTPHLHFEFHPGGGAAVNPTPLVASLC